MRSLIKSTGMLVASVLLGVMSYASVGAASIDNTGPGSDNSIIIGDNCDENYFRIEKDNEEKCEPVVDLDCTNDNDITIDINTDQNAGSGNAQTGGNTSGGGASSGNVSNDNNTDIDVDIDNGCFSGETDEDEETPVVPTPDKPKDGVKVLAKQIAVLPATGAGYSTWSTVIAITSIMSVMALVVSRVFRIRTVV